MEKLPKYDPPIKERKTREYLKNQLEGVEKSVNQKVTPNHAWSQEEVLKMDEAEVKEKFPKRYEIYVDFLRKNKQSKSLEDSELIKAKKWLGILNSLDDYIEKYEREISEDPRHLKQQEVFRAIRDHFEQGKLNGYVKLPTGSGKTKIFTRFLQATKQRSLIIVPTNTLVTQTVEGLEKDLGNASSQIGVVNEFSKDFDSQFIVTTYQSLIFNVKNGKIKPEDFPCLILDEAHKSLGQESSEIVKSFPNSIRLGFTATPEYSEEKTLKQLLNNEIFRMEVAEAILGGMLCSAHTEVVLTHVDLSKIAFERGKYREKDLARAVNIQSRNELALRKYLEDGRIQGKPAIAFCADIEHAESVTKLFNEAGVAAATLTEKTKTREREELTNKFKNGKIKVLCSVDVLREGFDAPNAEVCLNLRPTMSAVSAEQRGGRVLRLDPSNPEKVGYIIDFLDDDSLVNNRKRPSPVLYYEVLGATAVPRAKANLVSSAPADRFNSNWSSPVVIPGLDVVSTEGGFKDLLANKKEYERLEKQKRKEIQWREELTKRYPILEGSYYQFNRDWQDLKQDVLNEAGKSVQAWANRSKEVNDFLAKFYTSNPEQGYNALSQRLGTAKEFLDGKIRWQKDLPPVEYLKEKIQQCSVQIDSLSREWRVVKEVIRKVLENERNERIAKAKEDFMKLAKGVKGSGTKLELLQELLKKAEKGEKSF